MIPVEQVEQVDPVVDGGEAADFDPAGVVAAVEPVAVATPESTPVGDENPDDGSPDDGSGGEALKVVVNEGLANKESV